MPLRGEMIMIERERLLLYAVTDRRWTGRQTLLQQLEDALRGGVTLVQLREKDLAPAALVQEAREMKELCHRYGVPLLVDDDLTAALESGADGIHVGQGDLPVAEVRRRAGPDFIVGATAKTVEQAIAAERAGADYLGVGAVFPSPTKGDAIRITTEQLKAICAAVSIPCVAIGGITKENAASLRGCGAAGLAVISALFAAQDIRAAAAALLPVARGVAES